MSRSSLPAEKTVGSPLRTRGRRDGPFRFSVEEFGRMADLGFFDDRRVEMLDGVIYKMTSRPPHAIAMELTQESLRAVFGIGWRVRAAQPLDLGGRSLPEPDFAVIAGSARDAELVHPKTAALVVEISDATLRKDRTIKAANYARAGLADYWIVNLIDRQLEVYRRPVADEKRPGRFSYAEVTVVAESGRMAPLAAPDTMVAVADLLPRSNPTLP